MQSGWNDEKEKAYRKKIDFAIHLLQSIPQDGEIELCYSGGKDSDVILELAKMANIPFKAIYKNTTVDPPRTILHAKENGVEIRQPEMTYFQLIENKGFPSRWFRFCCSYLKEYKIYDRAIVGIRRAESVKRAKRYQEPEYCRVYTKNKKVKMYLPILEWTNEEVEHFIEERNIKCHSLYYDNKGNFCVDRRLGCTGCPLQSQKKLREDFKQNNKFFRLVMKSYKKYFEA